MSEPFTLRPADIKEPYRRWQLVQSLVEHGDTVEVEFFDDTNHTFRITGTYFGPHHHAESHNTVRNGDHKSIVVVATTFTWYSRVTSSAPITWPGGTCVDTPFVIPTTNIVRIENIDGPVSPIGLDEERLADAIRHAIGDNIGSGTLLLENVVADAVTNYKED